MPVISYLRADQPASRETRIFTLGVILIAIGGALAALTLVIAYSLALGAILGSQFGPTPSGAGAAGTLASILALVGLAVILIWTGIGSVRLRRWCRPIVICLSALMVAFGLLFLLDLFLQWYFLPHVAPALVRPSRPGGPPRGLTYVAVVLTTFALLGIVVPFIFFIALRDREVERTLDDADPNVYWTDRCDLPTLGFALMMLEWACVLLLLIPLALASPQTPVLGAALEPASAAGFLLLGAVLCVIAGHLVHTQSRIGPWLAILIMLAGGASAVVSAGAEPPPLPPGYQRYVADEVVPDDRTASAMLRAAVYGIPAILFALRVLRLRAPSPSNENKPTEELAAGAETAPTALPVPPLRVERAMLAERIRGDGGQLS